VSTPYPSWVVDKVARAIYADTYPDDIDTYEHPETGTARVQSIRQAYAAIGALQEAGYFAVPTPVVPLSVRNAFGQEVSR